MNSGSPDTLTLILIIGIIVIAVCMMILWFAMLIDAFKYSSKLPGQQSITWLVILICGGSIGGILYYIMVYKKRPSKSVQTLGEPSIPSDSYSINDNKLNK